MEKLSLYRTAAALPWSEIEVTQGNNVRITFYDGAEADCKKQELFLTPKQAKEIHKALGVMLENYFEPIDFVK